MRAFDPRFRSIAIGFDNLLDTVESAIANTANSFPPYDIEKTGDDSFRITLALAGYAESELDVSTADGVLTVKGTKGKDDEGRTWIHRGIANRSFERKFQLAEYVEVKSASMQDGLLRIDLVREVPETKRPKKVKIETASAAG